jgi:hypothetical protein
MPHMTDRHLTRAAVLAAAIILPQIAAAQATVADYQRAMSLRDRYQGLAINVVEAVTWIQNTQRFWYRRSVPGGSEFMLVDAVTREKRPAFDHAKLANALTNVIEPATAYTAVTLPFTTFTFVDGEVAIEFTVVDRQAAPPQGQPQGPAWLCELATYACRRQGRPDGGRGGRGGGLAGPVRPEDYVINAAAAKKSPDGKLEALINNYNVAIAKPANGI